MFYKLNARFYTQECKVGCFLAKEIIEKKTNIIPIDVLILLLPPTSPYICSYEVGNYK